MKDNLKILLIWSKLLRSINGEQDDFDQITINGSMFEDDDEVKDDDKNNEKRNLILIKLMKVTMFLIYQFLKKERV